MSELDDGIDWSLTTWEGSRHATLRDWVEEMADFARATIEWRRGQGLPYFDPYTGERVSVAAVVREDPP